MGGRECFQAWGSSKMVWNGPNVDVEGDTKSTRLRGAVVIRRGYREANESLGD